MESPLPTSQGHQNEEPYNTAGLQNVAEGEQPQEKKSMLGRVKARAKRIRDSLTNQGHSNDQDHPQDEEDNDEDDQEMLLDPEVPGAPINDSASVTAPAPSTRVNSGFPAPAPPKGVTAGLPKGYLDAPKVMKEDHSESIISEPTAVEDKHVQSSGVHAPKVVDPIGNVGGREGNFPDPTGNENSTGPIGNVGREENFTDPIGNVGGRRENLTDTIGNAKGGGENLGDGFRGSKGMEEDPHSPRKGGFEAFTPSNDKTKVSDPTGTGEEEEITPIIHSLDKMNISNEPQQKTKPEQKQNFNTASHDQFSPESTPTNTPSAVEATHVPEDKHVPFSSGVHVPKVVDPTRGSGENVGGQEGNFTDPTGNENFTGPIGNVGGQEENFTDPIGSVGGQGENLGNLGDGIRGSMDMEEDPHSPRKDVGGREENFSDPIGNFGGREEKPHSPRKDVGGREENFSDPIGNFGGREENPHSLRKDVGGREENYSDPIGNFGGREEKPHSPRKDVGGREENYSDPIGNFGGREEKPHSPRKDVGGREENFSDPIGNFGGREENPHSPRKDVGGREENLNTASHDQFSTEPTPTNTPANPHEFSSTRAENSPLDHLTENPSKSLDPLTENPSNQSSYVQMFSSAAASAKNVVTSSLGYGGTEAERHNEMLEGHPDSAKRHNEMQGREEATKPVGGGAVDNAQKITSPVAGAGSTVMSKVRGDDENKHASDNIESGGGPDKGVSDKLWPGDEDKELPEVISGARTNKGKEAGGERAGESKSGVGEVISDAVHKRAPEDDGEERRPMGKVTESKAVAERLGTGSGEEGVGAGGEVAGGSPGAGKGMVGMIRGTVSSWLGKGSESPTSQGTKYDGNQGIASGEAAHEHVQHDVGGTRPRDSSN